MCLAANHLVQDYLETKRVAFPRFYFVAPADLLDILSKGSNPQLIIRHLPKCFDNMHNLEFRKDDQGVPTKTAIGMYSGTFPLCCTIPKFFQYIPILVTNSTCKCCRVHITVVLCSATVRLPLNFRMPKGRESSNACVDCTKA